MQRTRRIVGTRILMAAGGLAALAALLPAPTAAEAIGDKLTLSGFGNWEYGKTDGNSFGSGTEEGEFDDGQFALFVSHQTSDRLRIAAKLFFEINGEAELELAQVEYRFSDAAIGRAGVVAHPFGISAEVFDNGTLRNFGHLPESIYGANGIASETLHGLALAGRRDFASGWALSYDVYAGELTPRSDGFFDSKRLTEEGEEAPNAEESEIGYRNVFGARAVLESPIDGLSFGLSAYRGTEDDDDSSVETMGGQVQFQRGAWDVRAEYFLQEPEGRIFSHDGYYIELARRLGDKWQIALRTENYQAELVESELVAEIPESQLRHEELSFGLNYWLSSNVVFRAAIHEVSGLRFVEGIADLVEQGIEPDEDTRLFTFGLAFAF